MLSNFQVFGNFLIIFLLWISSSFVLWKTYFVWIQFLKFVLFWNKEDLVCIMIAPCEFEENVYHAVIGYCINMNQIHLVDRVVQFFYILPEFCWLIYLFYWENLRLSSIIMDLFPFEFCPFCCIDFETLLLIWDCFVFLVDWHF